VGEVAPPSPLNPVDSSWRRGWGSAGDASAAERFANRINLLVHTYTLTGRLLSEEPGEGIIPDCRLLL